MIVCYNGQVRYKYYIWDLGGTLLDNYEGSTQAFLKTLTKYGRSGQHDVIYKALKVSTAFAIQKFAGDFSGFLSVYRAYEAEILNQPELFDGAKKVLDYIKERGGQNFLISHRDSHVYDLLEKTGIGLYFRRVLTSDDGFARKPAPESIFYLLETYHLAQEDTVTIGDREIDVEAGKRAGIATIHFDSVIRSASATFNVHSLKEIIDVNMDDF